MPSPTDGQVAAALVNDKNKGLIMQSIKVFPLVVACAVVLLSACQKAESPPYAPAAESAEAVAAPAAPDAIKENPLRDAYFGETHMHTAYSLDAYIGGTRLDHDDAYRYARGETVEVDGIQKARQRPLDFVAISDHAEYIGEMYSTMVDGAPGHDQALLKQLRNLTSIEDKQAWFLKYVVNNTRGDNPSHPPFYVGPDTTRSAWEVMVDAAQVHNEPGVFTTLIAFEWSGAPQGGNLHRNVIYRDHQVPDLPVSSFEVRREDQLWAWMAEQEAKGSKALAIPHNSNASKQMMFADVDAAGDPIDLEYAQTRRHFEPLIEMMQIKGNSEVHRKFWAADEFADFENADSIQKNSGRTFHKRDFVREGLKIGLSFEQKLGVNPFKYGFIGGTDNHNGLPSAVAEDSFIGGHGPEDGSVAARRDGGVGGWIDGKDLSIGSLAAVWATENTRAGIWDAMKRRETFATSGPRIKIRFFGGVELPSIGSDASTFVQRGYELGVPMGGDLGAIGTAPTFNVSATKDPDGANLDRIQIIKGWVNADGTMDEKIVNVAWSGDRRVDASGHLPAVGNTVDLKSALYTNDIGRVALQGSWTDDTFDPQQHAFYYARALEIPTPRWTTYDAVRNGLPLLEDVPATIQERAWTSPIWRAP
jgi:hypothetical protein